MEWSNIFICFCDLTVSVGAVDQAFTPGAAPLTRVRLNAELIGSVGFQVVNDSVSGWTCTIVPLPVPLPIPDSVEPVADGRHQSKVRKRRPKMWGSVNASWCWPFLQTLLHHIPFIWRLQGVSPGQKNCCGSDRTDDQVQRPLQVHFPWGHERTGSVDWG